MAQVNVDEILSNTQKGANSLSDISSQRADLANRSATLATEASANDVDAENAAKDELRQQQIIDAFSTNIGANANNPDTYIMGKLGATKREYAIRAVEGRKQVSAIDATSFFDNPITWLPNQFKADAMEQQANSDAAVADEASKQMQQINQELDDFVDHLKDTYQAYKSNTSSI